MHGHSTDSEHILPGALLSHLSFPGKPEKALQYNAGLQGFTDVQKECHFPVFRGIFLLATPPHVALVLFL
mgnify:CR=1 FL=1